MPFDTSFENKREYFQVTYSGEVTLDDRLAAMELGALSSIQDMSIPILIQQASQNLHTLLPNPTFQPTQSWLYWQIPELQILTLLA